VTLEKLLKRAEELYGFDTGSTEALIELFNDARQDAARLSGYPRKVVTAELNGDEIELPEDYLLASTVIVGGTPFVESDRMTVRQFENGELLPTGPGYWYDYTNDEGATVVKLWPEPASTAKVEFEYIYCGLDWTSGSGEEAPVEFPRWFHPKLISFVAAAYYETVEDNPELAEVAKGKAEQAVSDLIRYDNERQGGGAPFQIGIQGLTS